MPRAITRKIDQIHCPSPKTEKKIESLVDMIVEQTIGEKRKKEKKQKNSKRTPTMFGSM